MNDKVSAGALPDFMNFWDYSDPAGTERKFRALLPHAMASGDQPYVAELLTQIARTHSMRDEIEEAHRLLDDVEPRLSDQYPRPRLRYLLERGRTLNSDGLPEEARPLFLEAWDLANACGEDSLAVDAAHMMAIITELDEHLVWDGKALALVEASEDETARKWLGALYNNSGWAHFDQQHYAKAMDLFQKALAWWEPQQQFREIQIAKWCIGRTYRAMGRIQQALAIQEALHHEIEASDEDPDGFVFEELAECYLALGRAEAVTYFALAYEVLSQDPNLVMDEPERIQRIKDLSGQ